MSPMNQTERPHRILYRIASGNFEGQVEESVTLHADESLDAIRMYKIRMLDADEPLDEDDVRYVVDHLRKFATTLLRPR